MAKRFKFRLSLPSFQLCRPTRPSSVAQCPLPANSLLFSPINSKAFDVSFPSFADPPPSPNHASPKLRGPPPKLTPLQPCTTPSSHSDYKWLPACDSDSCTWQSRPPKAEKIEGKKERGKKKKAKASACKTASSSSGWFSTEEPETLASSSSVRSDDSPCNELGHSLEKATDGGRKKDKSSHKVERPRKCVGRRRVEKSFVVVKRSEEPYKDFKRSMLEMIVEKEMLKAEDLEQLLQCLLSLNSPHHHGVIVQAFSEIWELLFHKYP